MSFWSAKTIIGLFNLRVLGKKNNIPFKFPIKGNSIWTNGYL